MIKDTIYDDLSIDVLDHIYKEGGDCIEPMLSQQLPCNGGPFKSSICRRAHCSRSEPVSVADTLFCLEESELVTRQNAEVDSPYFLTGRGLSALKQASERKLKAKTGRPTVSGKDVLIESVVSETSFLVGERLAMKAPVDFVKTHRLRVWGRVGSSSEPLMLARVKLHVVNAHAASVVGNHSLEEVITSSPDTAAFLDAICNHHEDGEPCGHVYELGEALGLEDSVGHQLILVDTLRVLPALIGKGLSQRLIRKLALNYGAGGGVMIMAASACGIQSARAVDSRVFHPSIAANDETGLQIHPGDQRFLVGGLTEIVATI